MINLPRVIVSMLLLLGSMQAVATSVLPVSLQRMVSAADVIFRGTAISNEVKLDQQSGRIATFTTFEVTEAIKGDPGTTHTIKQVGGELPGSQVRQIIRGVPRFTTGKDYVVFLPKASNLGFSSPIGLSQGRFNILDLNGEPTVSNGRPVAALMNANVQQELPKALSIADTADAPALKALNGHPTRASLADFIKTVRGMIDE